MRPLMLRMQAFGPYAGEQLIDFTKLGNRTMFVISGKTGSGKTTIFDGISFAIYGKASGDDRASSDLRSQFAQDEVLTEVSLQFSLKGKIYYIIRSPQQEKKKTRGEGYTVINAKAELYEINDNGEQQLLAANVRDTDEKIKEIIGLDANQFKQILMIPQGEFRKLLTSDSREKEVILQRLFHTELYKKIEEKLKENASVLKRQVDSGGKERERLLKGIVFEENEELENALLEESINDTYILELLSEQLEKMYKQSNQLTIKIEQEKLKRDEAKRQVDAAEDLLKQFRVLEELKSKKIILMNRQQEIDKYSLDIERAQKANKLQNQEELCHRIKKELDGYKKMLEKEDTALKNMEHQWKIARENLLKEEQQIQVRDELKSELLKLQSLQDDVYSFATRHNELRKIEVEWNKCQHSIETEKIKNEKNQKELNEKRTKLESLKELKISTFELENQATTMENIIKSLNSLLEITEKSSRLETKVKELSMELSGIKSALTDAQATLDDIEDRWLKGQAGHLAASLSEGIPCPVCGSTDHPKIAELESDFPNQEDVKAAKRRVDELQKQQTSLESVLVKYNTEYEMTIENRNELQQIILTSIPSFKLEDTKNHQYYYNDKIKKLRFELSNFQNDLKQIPLMEKAVQELESNVTNQTANMDKLVELERNLSISFTQASATVQKLSEMIPEDIREKDNYDRKVEKLQKKLTLMDQRLEQARNTYTNLNEALAHLKGTVENITANVKNATEKLTSERNVFLEMLENEQFESYTDYHEAKKSSNEIELLHQKIRSHHEELRSVRDRITDYETNLKGKQSPKLEVLTQNLHVVEQRLKELEEQHSRIYWNIKKNEDVQIQVNKINDEIKQLENQYNTIGHLADITKGQNELRISFERFVLGSFLDDILRAANIRLLKMTSGRFELIRNESRSKGNVQSGLELLVFDQYTGQERHVKTLSGGESFKAALSLALGLSDVVQENAGGVSLETMFIDEGFGTLDPESLDNAIEALMDIQSSGRLVGIISHVPELKERIDARLEVSASHEGSKADFYFIGN